MTTSTQLTVWFGSAANERVLGPVVALDANGTATADPEVAPRRAIVVAARRGRALGALLVPTDLASEVALNGTCVGIGLHGLRHGDRIDVAGHPCWVSGDTEPVEATYDPAQHGEDQRCLRTKTRLTAGEPIVVCPGTPTTACAGLFRHTAWRPTLRCHQCGFDPRAPRWRPVLRRPGARLADLLALAKGGPDAGR